MTDVSLPPIKSNRSGGLCPFSYCIRYGKYDRFRHECTSGLDSEDEDPASLKAGWISLPQRMRPPTTPTYVPVRITHYRPWSCDLWTLPCSTPPRNTARMALCEYGSPSLAFRNGRLSVSRSKASLVLAANSSPRRKYLPFHRRPGTTAHHACL